MANAKGSYIGGVPVMFKDEAARNMISKDVYDATKTYQAGDFCIWENELKRATAETSGAFDTTAWESVTLADVARETNSNLPIVLTVGKFKPQDYKFLVLNLRDQTVNSSKLNVVYRYSADWTTLSFNLYYNANMHLCSIKIKIDTSGNITFAEGYRFDTVNSTIYDYNAPTIDSIIGIK